MNAEEQALYRDVIENPEEDTPRLLYADWLEDHASLSPGNEARAAFIRLAIKEFREHGTAPYPEISTDSDWGSADSRIKDLLTGHGYEYCPTVDDPVSSLTSFGWRRGFIGAMSAPWQFWLTDGHRLVENHPIEYAVIRNFTPHVGGHGLFPQFNPVRIYFSDSSTDNFRNPYTGTYPNMTLPRDLFCHLQKSHPTRDPSSVRAYATIQDALKDISHVLLNHCRQKANLPPLKRAEL